MTIEFFLGCIRCCIEKFKLRKYKQVKFLKLSYIPKDVEFEISSKSKMVELKNLYGYRRNVSVRVREGAELYIDEGTTLNNGTIITCRDMIRIGKNVLIGPNVMIFDNDHDYRSNDLSRNFKTAPIVIEDNVWIGGNSIILRGTTIGENAVVGGGTVIKGIVESNCICVNDKKTKMVPFEKEK